MMMNALLEHLGFVIPGIRPCRRGHCQSAAVPPFALLICILQAGKLRHGQETLPTQSPRGSWELLRRRPTLPSWEIKTKGGVRERGREDAVSRSAGAVPPPELRELSHGQRELS